MKSTYINFLCAFIFALTFTNCNDDDEQTTNTTTEGSVEIKWDNVVGDKDMNLVAKQDLDFSYETDDKQQFNITSFGYYVTNIILEGEDGLRYEDEVIISASETKGVYHIVEGNFSSNFLKLKNVPVGKYNKITFTIGIPEEGVQEGAAAGVLDPAGEAWFWNWNAGYIGFAIEGHASTSTQSFNDNNGFITPENSFAIHIGGWRDIDPLEGQSQIFVNNVKTITINFPVEVNVQTDIEPSIHLYADAKALLDKAQVDFSTTFSVHAPAKGKPFADVLDQVFSYGHTHQ